MGDICCKSDGFLSILEDLISELLGNLRINKLSYEEANLRFTNLFESLKEKNKEFTKKKIKETLINSSPENQNIDFQELVVEKLYEKIENLNLNLNLTVLMIYIFPLLNNEKNLYSDNFFNLLIILTDNHITYEKIEKYLFPIIEFYTKDLNEILYQFMESQFEKEAIKIINEHDFSALNISLYLEKLMDKKTLIKYKLWNEKLTYDDVKTVFKNIGIYDYSLIRNNLLSFVP